MTKLIGQSTKKIILELLYIAIMDNGLKGSKKYLTHFKYNIKYDIFIVYYFYMANIHEHLCDHRSTFTLNRY